jgi:hypothetical protein
VVRAGGLIRSSQEFTSESQSTVTSSDAAKLFQLICAYYQFDRIRFRSNTIEEALRTLLKRRSLGRIWITHDGAKAVGYITLTFNYDLEFGDFEGYNGIRL